jgi:hypothetical protein
MRKFISLFCILFLNFLAIAQEQNNYEFQPLPIIEKITQNVVDKIKLKDKIKNTQ